MRARRSPMSNAATAVVLAGAAAFAASCESGFDRNDQIVNSLRILGVAEHVDNGDGVDWADAEVGDTVELDALVANPANAPDLTVTWLACLPTLTATTTPCIDDAVLRDPVNNLIPLAANPSSGVVELGVGASVSYTVPAEAQPLLDSLVARADGSANAECAVYVAATIIVIAQSSDGEVFTASKDLRLAPWSKTGPGATDSALQYYIRNSNPHITALDIPTDRTACAGQTLVASCETDADCGGAAGSCSPDHWCPPAPFPDGNQVICGQIPDADVQTYYQCGLNGPTGTLMELPRITWYQTAGTQASVSNSGPTGGDPDLASRTFEMFTRPAGPFTLYGVVRDGRDGENWIAQDFP
jgi:hypothetical protein